MGDPKPTASLSGGLLARKGGARPAMRRPSIMGNNGNAAVSQDDLGWNDMGYDVNPDPDTPMDHEHESKFNPLANAVPEATPEVKKQQEMIARQLQAQPETDYPKEDIADAAKTTSLPVGGTWSTEEQAKKAKPEDLDATISAGLSKMVSASVAEAKAISKLEREQPEQAEAAAVEAKQVEAPVAKAASTAPAKKPRKRAAPGSKAKAAFTLRLDKDRHLKLRLACAVTNKSAQMLVTEALDQMLSDMPEIGQIAANVPGKK